MKRPATPASMKIDCLLYRNDVVCIICGELIIPGDEIEWDHIHELADEGGHIYTNLRPIHKACHAAKTKKATKQRAHIKRLAKGKKKPKGRKMQSRGFSKAKVKLGRRKPVSGTR